MADTGPSPKVKQALFALSGNQCAFPGCDTPMYVDGSIVGEVCHIRAQSAGGPRYDAAFEDVHQVANLVLLCAVHHKIVDDQPDEYTVGRLLDIKRQHEAGGSVTPLATLVRIMEALAPDVPEHWNERPGAPEFRFSLASSARVRSVSVDQFAGTDIGNLQYRFRHGPKETEWKKPTRMTATVSRLEDFTTNEIGEPFEIQLKFWWQGAERTYTRRWATEAAFHSADWEDVYA